MTHVAALMKPSLQLGGSESLSDGEEQLIRGYLSTGTRLDDAYRPLHPRLNHIPVNES
jgi:uncharacterized protein YfaQ (DUF2300 family)